MTPKELNEAIEALCRAKGLKFKPWEPLPWQVSADGPYPYSNSGTACAEAHPKAQRLRRQLIAELNAARS